jgi:hypothetical protein
MTDDIKTGMDKVTIDSGNNRTDRSESTNVNQSCVKSVKLNTEVLNTQHFMMEYSDSSENFDMARKALYQLGIKTSYDDTRVIYTTAHAYKNKLVSDYSQECNGLILEKSTWKPLMVPPRNLRFNINTDASNTYLHQGLYHIYKAEDGTCINFYYYNDKWCMSTARGYEMNNIKWETVSYQQLFTECLKEVGMTWETFTNNLDKTRCYSFGFRHPKFHRFYGHTKQVKYKIWFIQSVNLDNLSEQYLWASDKSPTDKINSQEFYTKPVASLRELYKTSVTSLDQYINDSKSEPCFGFILRSVNFETTGVHSDLFIESSLMRAIRQIWYENKLINICHTNHWDKEDVITFNAYLDHGLYETFIYLFPQYINRFSYYSKLLQMVVKQMVVLNNNGTKNSLSINTGTVIDDSKQSNTLIEDSKQSNTVKLVAKNLYDRFTNSVNYNIHGKKEDQKHRVFSEYITHKSNLETLMPLFTVHLFNKREDIL